MLIVKVSQTCPTLCDPMDSIAHGILQARILEWVAFSFSRGSPQPRNQTQVSRIAGRLFTSWATREAQEYWSGYGIISWIFLPAISLLVYRNATDFYVFILYLATLLNSLMSSSNFLVVFLGYSVYSIMSFEQWQFRFFLSTFYSFSFSPLTAMGRTSKLYWIRMVRLGILSFRCSRS